jgi:RimJ/RimL family protein N-acetyltransferase
MRAERVALVAVTDSDFEWMLAEKPQTCSNFQLPPGGVDAPEVLETVRRITRDLHKAHCHASWMILSGLEVVGLCSYRRPPRGGSVEIGYGIALSRRNRGCATLAVAQMVLFAESDPAVRLLVAETSLSNPPSMQVLQKNDFERSGTRIDKEDGPVALWQRRVANLP